MSMGIHRERLDPKSRRSVCLPHLVGLDQQVEDRDELSHARYRRRVRGLRDFGRNATRES